MQSRSHSNCCIDCNPVDFGTAAARTLHQGWAMLTLPHLLGRMALLNG